MSYEVLNVVGDVNPLQYGGWIVGSRSTHIDCLVIEPIDWEDGKRQGEGIDCLVYHVALDKESPDGEWYDSPEFRKHLEDGQITWEEFSKSIQNDDPAKRVWAWREIAEYHGIQNLDDCPTRETEAALRKRFALPFYRARKRGVTVYA